MWGLREPDGKTGTARFPQAGEMARPGTAVSFKNGGPGQNGYLGHGPDPENDAGVSGTAPLSAPSEAQGQRESLFVCWTN